MHLGPDGTTDYTHSIAEVIGAIQAAHNAPIRIEWDENGCEVLLMDPNANPHEIADWPFASEYRHQICHMGSYIRSILNADLDAAITAIDSAFNA